MNLKLTSRCMMALSVFYFAVLISLSSAQGIGDPGGVPITPYIDSGPSMYDRCVSAADSAASLYARALIHNDVSGAAAWLGSPPELSGAEALRSQRSLYGRMLTMIGQVQELVRYVDPQERLLYRNAQHLYSRPVPSGNDDSERCFVKVELQISVYHGAWNRFWGNIYRAVRMTPWLHCTYSSNGRSSCQINYFD